MSPSVAAPGFTICARAVRQHSPETLCSRLRYCHVLPGVARGQQASDGVEQTVRLGH